MQINDAQPRTGSDGGSTAFGRVRTVVLTLGIAAAMAVSGCAEGVAFGPPTPGGSASAY